ncbi:TetR/AcrR family transcriptional regulator [Petropleomorpha daqingensis]|uniref:AcrR family transcriptional regulator n=1 Tax=Petropleomorpha daqingensis TaxID=2026353 RepID=A0A853CP93_9ACTN|nr:TetR/AcrR family transcriptional regulator [Petropleomorpha daqingensis]NYJ08609.1 AcrR family transcriptional regulator [Petropleomorpha daqingensis]
MSESVRTRDPDRRERILRAAAELVAERGFHAVSMADIGAASGIVGSGVYRHFDSKSAVLLALLDDGMERLLAGASAAVGSGRPDAEVLDELVRDQVRFAVDEALLVRLWLREVQTLPDGDQRRLRRLQRHYVEEWVHTLRELRPELLDADARARVHVAIGAIQSAATWNAGVPREALADLLTECARRCLYT